MDNQPRVVIIRGPSGSGKSSLATALRQAQAPRPLAIVGQDVIRRTVLGTGDDLGTSAVDLVDLVARHALRQGFDVVVEGILNPVRYGGVLRGLSADFPTHAFLYDLSFEATAARHAGKVDPGFGENELRQWWRGVEPIEGLRERRLAEEVSLEAARDIVLAQVWGPRS